MLNGEESTCQCRSPGSVPGQEDPLEKEMATHSGIPAGNSMDRGVCRATVHRVMEKSDRTEQLST